MLLTAAAEPVGDVPLLLRALAVLEVPVSAAAPAEAAGLIELGARVRFRHPLVRSAAYRAADPTDRRRVHQALAEAIDPDLDPDRRAWHRAQGAAGPDEDVAAELVAFRRSGPAPGRCLGDGGVPATGDRAHPGPGSRARSGPWPPPRPTLRAGAFETASRLLVTADEGPVDALHQAR